MHKLKFLNTMNCLIKQYSNLCKPSNTIVLFKYCYSTDKSESPVNEKEDNVKKQEQTETKHEIEPVTNISLPIYSRNGDSGKTQVNGIKLSKTDKIFDAIGATDELSAQLGLAKEFGRHHAYGDKLLRVQILLVNVISAIQKSNAKEKISFSPSYTKELEDWIDEYAHDVPPPSTEHYVLPGGGIASAALHVAWCACRKTERNIIPLVQDGVIDQEILAYVNRLSDFLFTISRFACKMDKEDEHTTLVHHPDPGVK